MNVLITGAHGFVGRNLTESLKTVRDGKDKTRGLPAGLNILEATRETAPQQLEEYLAQADFVFHLAGANRPQNPAEFMAVNCGYTTALFEALEKAGNCCPVMLASSIQAAQQNPYGLSKRAAEDAARAHAARTGARVLLYRLPNLFGKWCRPNYNSVVATFCHNIANGLPIHINDAATELTLCYIDDVVDELLRALAGQQTVQEDFCTVPVVHTVTLGRIAELLRSFHDQPQTLVMPQMPPHSFAKKLYSTYLSYLPREAVAFALQMRCDERGSFTELLKTPSCGQFSVNITKPGVTKGQHWHHSKWELFIVASGHALIRQRQLGSDEVLEFEVTGERMQAIHMLPGYTHSICNLSDTEDLVTVMWANEPLDPAKPDTFFEKV